MHCEPHWLKKKESPQKARAALDTPKLNPRIKTAGITLLSSSLQKGVRFLMASSLFQCPSVDGMGQVGIIRSDDAEASFLR
jgi:hypothetical protein